MSRRIITSELQSASQTESANGAVSSSVDGYFDRIMKYIPADVVALWLFISGLISSNTQTDPNAGTIHWVAFGVGFVLTVLWTRRQTTEPGKKTALVQIAISGAAFVVWVFALGGPFTSLEWYLPYYGSIVLAVFTVGSGLIVPPE